MPLTLYFSSHEAEAITPRLRQLFAKANMVLIEQSFNEEDGLNLNLLNELSRGNLLPEDVFKIGSGIGVQPFPDFTRELNSMIFRSGKPILLENSPVDVTNAVSYDALLRQEFRDTSIRTACRQLAENLRKRAEYEKKRDNALAQQLTTLVHDHPDSDILVIRGQGHQHSLVNALAALSTPATTFTSHDPLQHMLTDEAIQKMIAGERPTRRELLKVLVEQAETRTSGFRPTQANIRSLRERITAMNERQCEKYLRKRLKLT